MTHKVKGSDGLSAHVWKKNKQSEHCFRNTLQGLGSSEQSHVISDVRRFIQHSTALVPDPLVYNKLNHWWDLCCVFVILCERERANCV